MGKHPKDPPGGAQLLLQNLVLRLFTGQPRLEEGQRWGRVCRVSRAKPTKVAYSLSEHKPRCSLIHRCPGTRCP